ncbi:IucA/IucC family protein, partial [Escherichia coli]|nr:IucA/IucC family protein [Escherichia coli]
QALAIPFNHELIEQLENSVLVTEQFLNVAPKSHHNEFIASEQSLIWGHTFHPTPKSRSGVTMDDLLAFSPEVGAQVPLYWFEVDTSLLDVLSSDGEANPAQHMLQQLAPQHATSNGKTL